MITNNGRVAAPILSVALAVASCAAWAAASDDLSVREIARLDSYAMPIYLDRGAAGLCRALAALHTRASMLMINAHPDDEDGGMLASLSRGLGARVALMSLTRGEGGQNAMTPDLYEALGLIRTQELLQGDRNYGVDQYWGTVIDYGFSKTREEALAKWGHDRVLEDAVRIVRLTRPLVITSLFNGAATDGHGNHQVAGQIAQEAFVAAGDPTRFPDQIRDGLRPWKPLKVYARAPFFAQIKDKKVYDYAIDEYVPILFHDYITNTSFDHLPTTDLTIAEGDIDGASGLSFLQIAREGWGFQKTQNGGATLPQPALYSAPYHRYGSRVPVHEKENSFYDGIDISLEGISSLSTGGDSAFLKSGLHKLTMCTEEAAAEYRPRDPAAIARTLAEGLSLTRDLIRQVDASTLASPGKEDIHFELQAKARQFETALSASLSLSFDTVVVPEKKATGPLAGFAPPPAVFVTAVPGQSFHLEAHFLNGSTRTIGVEALDVRASDGKNWSVASKGVLAKELKARSDLIAPFDIHAPGDATVVRPYFVRPNGEQPYYDILDRGLSGLSSGPYPLWASVRVSFGGVSWESRKIVQNTRRVEGIGTLEEPLLIEPALSVSVSPAAGAVPLSAKSFDFTCTLRSNQNATTAGKLRLSLPEGWTAKPADRSFTLTRDGESESFLFQIDPHQVKAERYRISAVAEAGGKKYNEGFQLLGYGGLRQYPYFRPATYRATGVDVKTASSLRVGFLPGTGDDVPRALQNLGVSVQMLTTADIEMGDLSGFEAIVLGVRAYTARPELQTFTRRLLAYVEEGGTLVVQYNTQRLDEGYGPYPFSFGSNPAKVVDENAPVRLLDATSPLLNWPNKISDADFAGWEEERGHGFMATWDSHYEALLESHDPDQKPQRGGLLLAHYGKGLYVYDAYALYRQLPAGVGGAYRIFANLISAGQKPKSDK